MNELNQRSTVIHPSSIAIVLVLMGITSLFLALSVSYIYSLVSQNIQPVSLPALFYFNTLILMSSSYFIWMARKSFDEQSYSGLMRNLTFVIVTTLLFLAFQLFGWWLMVGNQMTMQQDTSHGYLYAISILHFLHVIAGLPFLIGYMRKMYLEFKKNEDSLFFIEEKPPRRLKLIGTYWHFIDILWIYLILFFAINSIL